jgi:hypothetical protein
VTPRVDLCPLVVTAMQASENERWRGVRHQNSTVQCSTGPAHLLVTRPDVATQFCHRVAVTPSAPAGPIA